MNPRSWPEHTRYRVCLAAGLTLLMAKILAISGVTADAYITFRVVDNAVHGYGLRWNIDERVQVYTHPLWMLLHIPLYALWDNIFMITILLGASCTLGTLLIIQATFKRSWMQLLAFLLLPLASSASFTRYATSGLENSLSYLLFAAFGWALVRARAEKRWLYMSLFASLSLVNRLDLIMFYAPIFFYLWLRGARPGFRQCVLGSLPIFSWLLFSLIYYGFLFPNTKYAKLDTGLSLLQYLEHGLHYLTNMFVFDISSAFFWCAAIITGLAGIKRYLARDPVVPDMAAVAMGILGYSLYIVYIGGDYLAGRFWSLPVLASVWLIYGLYAPRMSERVCTVAALLLLCVQINYPNYIEQARICRFCTWQIPMDLNRLSLLPYLSGQLELPQINRSGPVHYSASTAMAMPSYKAGPNEHVIDIEALTDPLLARLPSSYDNKYSIGHFKRVVPAGYLYARQTGSLVQMPPLLAAYYEKLHLIVSGDVWDGERLLTILRFNLGDYNYLRDRYIEESGAVSP